MENAVEDGAHLIERVRLENQIAKTHLERVFAIFWADVAGGHDDGNVRPNRQQLAGEFET